MKQKKQETTRTLFPSFDDSKFRALIEKSFDVIIVLDARGKILYASPSIVRLYGRTYEEILGINGFKYIHPADFPRIVKLFAQIVFHPKKPISAELRIRHKNGDWRWVVGIATNLLQNKNICGIVINFHDITERKRLEERKDEFIGVASHELKTPITTLTAYLQMLNHRYGKTNTQLQIYLEKIETQLQRLTQLINELLDVSRIQEGKITLRREKFNIGVLVQEIIDDMQILTEKHHITSKILTQKNIYADKYRITQVLINLLSNAIKYSQNASRIIVHCRGKNEHLLISVKDFGVGIPKKNCAKIFERFYQGENQNKHGGLGLGLYISSTFVRQHGGKIWVRSQVGKGSLFTFSLPIRKK